MNEINLEINTEPHTMLCPCCSIPLSISNALVELSTLQNNRPAHENGSSSQAMSNINPIKIFLVDDHRSFMDGLQMVIDMQKPHMEIIGTATNPDEAIDVVVRLEPDVILLDLDFGDSSGLDILPVLVEKTEAKILILTGVRDSKIHDATIMKGAHGVLSKGDSVKVMLKAIERVHAGGVWIGSDVLERVMGQGSENKTISNNPEARKIATLTPREREVITALLKFENSTSVEIAAQLGISKHTLKNNLTSIYNKLEMKNRVQLMRFALNHKAELTELYS